MNLKDLFVVGLNHRTAPVAVRERFSLPPEHLSSLVQYLQAFSGVAEVVVLSTCNRTEIYGVRAARGVDPQQVFALAFPDEEEIQHDWIYIERGENCVRHLFRVASSLDSLVVGETEIVGQVKRAYQLAHAAGGTGKLLNRLFQRALSVSKAVRTSSGIGRCSTSVGAVSVDLANHLFGEDLRDKTILIVGAGKIGETTLRHLSKHGVKAIFVCNRSFERARELALRFNGQPVPFPQLPGAVAGADIVISSTGAPHHVITREILQQAMNLRRHRPLFLVDLAVPRDVDPQAQECESVYLYNIDQLAEIGRQNRRFRQAEAGACEELVLRGVREFAGPLAPPPARRFIGNLVLPEIPALQLGPAVKS